MAAAAAAPTTTSMRTLRPGSSLARTPREPCPVRLTSLGRELVHRTDDGRFRVHGAFVPNLLINGCGEPLAFPTHTLRAVVGAAAVLSRVPGASVEHLSYFMRLPGMGG